MDERWLLVLYDHCGNYKVMHTPQFTLEVQAKSYLRRLLLSEDNPWIAGEIRLIYVPREAGCNALKVE